MGQTIWVLEEGETECERDFSLMLMKEKFLDRLAQKLSIKKLSDFYDYSELTEAFDGPCIEPDFVSPGDVRKSLQALINAIKDGASGFDPPDNIMEELEYCLRKVVKAENNHSRIRLTIIP